MSSSFPLLVVCILLFGIAHCYYLSPIKLEWIDANVYCQSFCGSELAVVTDLDLFTAARSIAENSWTISTSYGSNSIWIGLYFENKTSSLTWIDGSSVTFGSDATAGSPWKQDQDSTPQSPNHTCIASFGHSDYKWGWNDCTFHQRFMCNNCDGKMNKYIMINQKMGYTQGLSFCNEIVNTSLASVHSQSDFEQTGELCNYDASWPCFIGLNDFKNQSIYEWTDGTTFDYGTNYNTSNFNPPWRFANEPNNPDEHCISIYEQDLLWNDIVCNDDGNTATFLCNMPSELCYHDNWFLPNTWGMNECDIRSLQGNNNNNPIILTKQWNNGDIDGMLAIEYMFSVLGTMDNNDPYGTAGVTVYNFADTCSYWYIGIDTNWNIFFSIIINDTVFQNETYPLQGNYSYGVYYRLKVEFQEEFSLVITISFEEERFWAQETTVNTITGTKMSGSIGLKHENLYIIGKSLFVSGVAEDVNNPSFFDECVLPTLTPTINPTNLPSNDPTSSPTTSSPTTKPSYTPTTTVLSTYSPTEAPQYIVNYGVVITITFEYQGIDNITFTLPEIATVLTNITQEIILDQLFGDGILNLTKCNVTGTYNITIMQQYDTQTDSYKTTINTTIFVCDEDDQMIIKLWIDSNDNELITEFVNDVNNDTILLIADEDSIQLTSTSKTEIIPITTLQPTYNPESTQHEEISEQDHKWLIIYSIIGAVGYCFIVLCIAIIFKVCRVINYKNKQNKHMHTACSPIPPRTQMSHIAVPSFDSIQLKDKIKMSIDNNAIDMPVINEHVTAGLYEKASKTSVIYNLANNQDDEFIVSSENDDNDNGKNTPMGDDEFIIEGDGDYHGTYKKTTEGNDSNDDDMDVNPKHKKKITAGYENIPLNIADGEFVINSDLEDLDV